MTLQELAIDLTGLFQKLVAVLADRANMAQAALEATRKAQADANTIADLQAEVARLNSEDAATDAQQIAVAKAEIAAEYEGKLQAAEGMLAATIADQEAATATIAAAASSVSGLLGDPSATMVGPVEPEAAKPAPEVEIAPVPDPTV